jgi:hypothetical protein
MNIDVRISSQSVGWYVEVQIVLSHESENTGELRDFSAFALVRLSCLFFWDILPPH